MTDYIPYKDTGYFSEFITDYLSQKEELRCLYHRFPLIDNFLSQLNEKQVYFPKENRRILVESLESQYKNLSISEKTHQNIQSLKEENTFTITTGHQLSLFTGPLYFIYKIISTIISCQQLKQLYPQYQFVPIYWMATEDHDFQEINHFTLQGQKLSWHSEQKGMVGDFSTEELYKVANILKITLGKSHEAQYLTDLFEKTYTQHSNLSAATRYLVNELFAQYGLVIIDGNDKSLKKLLFPYFKKELTEHISQKKIEKTLLYIKGINRNYPEQVHPREINIFYVKKGLRERIVNENGKYKVLNTNIQFTEEEILNELEDFPERFSPNVILRPLYQEIILPNLAYIGGGGEIAYWLELKEMFTSYKVPFPILMLRNSVLLISEKQQKNIDRLNLTHYDIFLKNDLLANKITKRISEIPIDFTEQKQFLQKQFNDLFQIASHTDKSFLGAVRAQEAKQLKGLEHLEKRLLKAQKKKYKDQLDRAISLRISLFPKESLQERVNNFSEYMIETQGQLIKLLIRHLNPFDFRFVILCYEEYFQKQGECIEYFK
jgi:bacillithiol biosynthesis cysteine-adding enzyme bshC